MSSESIRPRPGLRTLTEVKENTFIFEKPLALPVALCKETHGWQSSQSSFTR